MGQSYDDSEDTSILFRPISPDERFSQTTRKPLQASHALSPMTPGQLYYAPYSSPAPTSSSAADQQPKPAAPALIYPRSPASLAPPSFTANTPQPPAGVKNTAAVPTASSHTLPPYLQKQPRLIPAREAPTASSPAADMARRQRIASTFVSAQSPPEPLTARASSEAQPDEAEPLYSASPRRAAASPAAKADEASSQPIRKRRSPTGHRPDYGEIDEYPPIPPPDHAPVYSLQDEIAAFFNGGPERESAAYPGDFSPFGADRLSEPSYTPYSQTQPYPSVGAFSVNDTDFEMESLPQSGALSPDDLTPHELAYRPPFYAPGNPSDTFDPQAFFEPFDPGEAGGQQEPQHELHAPPPAPAYVPKTAASHGKAGQSQKPSKAKAAPAGSNTFLAKQAAPQPPKPPIRWRRVAALAAAAGMLVFCAIAGGKIVYHMATNERAMQEVKAAYQQQQGSSLYDDATKVDLPPLGVTFEPAPTAQAVSTAQPSYNNVVANPISRSHSMGSAQQDTAQQETVQPTQTPAARTRLNRYPDNTLRNVLDSMKALVQEYPDVIGRLTIPGVLEEIVVQRNNTYYLTHNFRGALADGGAVYADETCSLKVPPENLLLRGQDNVPGKLFTPLWQYQSGGESFVADATIASLTTLYEEASYALFAVIVADSDPASPNYFNYASYPTFATDEQMMAYVENAMHRSLYRFSTSVSPGDRLLTLATLSSAGDGKCLVLIFRMLRNGEQMR